MTDANRVTGNGMPTLLMKTGRVPRAPALGTRPAFLPLKTAPPTWQHRGFSRQSEGRHNTLYFASGKVCAKGLRPLWIPRRSGYASRGTGRSRAPFPLRLVACPAALRGVRAEGRRERDGSIRHSVTFAESQISDIGIDNDNLIGYTVR